MARSSCAAINCRNARQKTAGLSFFRFPKDSERYVEVQSIYFEGLIIVPNVCKKYLPVTSESTHLR